MTRKVRKLMTPKAIDYESRCRPPRDKTVTCILRTCMTRTSSHTPGRDAPACTARINEGVTSIYQPDLRDLISADSVRAYKDM